MKTLPHAIALAAAVVASAIGLFAWGQHVAASDARLFDAYDRQHTELIARACGKHGALWQHPQSGRYACLYVNPDGETLIRSIPDAPLLADLR